MTVLILHILIIVCSNIESESGSDMMFLYNRDNTFNDLYNNNSEFLS